MSESTDRKDGFGVQAYRWIVLGALGLISTLSLRLLNQIDKTSDKVDVMQIQVTDMKSTFESRINAHAQRLDTVDRRNDSQDIKIDALQQRVWRIPETRIP